MKISRSASSPPSGTAGKVSGATGKKHGDFAARLDKADGEARIAATQSRGAHASSVSSVSDISADLKAGKITPQAAIDKVIDRIVAKQLGIHASPAAKEQIGAALRERLADDPLLAAKVRALSEG